MTNYNGFLKWDLKRKVKFKNIYVYGTITGGKITVQGSNNNSDWTDLGNITASGPLVITEPVPYRYIRLYCETTENNASDTVTVNYIEGTT